jgi:hypothetical protein
MWARALGIKITHYDGNISSHLTTRKIYPVRRLKLIDTGHWGTQSPMIPNNASAHHSKEGKTGGSIVSQYTDGRGQEQGCSTSSDCFQKEKEENVLVDIC